MQKEEKGIPRNSVKSIVLWLAWVGDQYHYNDTKRVLIDSVFIMPLKIDHHTITR